MDRWLKLLFTLLMSFVVSQSLNAATLKDPTRPQMVAEKAQQDQAPSDGDLPALRAIINNGNQREALFALGSKTVGESVSGYTIIAIDNDQVVLKRQGQLFHLKIFPVQVAESKGKE